MEIIKETIVQVMSKLKKQSLDYSDHGPEALLKKLFSKKECAHIKVNYFKKGVIGVQVDSSAWLYYLSLQKEHFLDKLRRNSPEVKDIRFFAGEINA